MESAIFKQRTNLKISDANFAKIVQCLGTSAHIIAAAEEKLAIIRIIIFDIFANDAIENSTTFVANESTELLVNAVAHIFYNAGPDAITDFARQQTLRPPVDAWIYAIFENIRAPKPTLQIAANKGLAFAKIDSTFINIDDFLQTCFHSARTKEIYKAMQAHVFGAEKTILINAYRMRAFALPLLDFTYNYVKNAARDCIAVVIHDTCVDVNHESAQTVLSRDDVAITMIFSREGFGEFHAINAALKKMNIH